MSHHDKLRLALTASKVSALKLRRWKEAARVAPPTAAKGSFPYFTTTCAEKLPRHKPVSLRRAA